MRVAPAIVLSDGERGQLESWARGRSTPHRLVMRAKVVLDAAEGRESKEIAKSVGVSEQFVCRWRGRFHRLRLSGISKDAPRSGRTASIPAATIERIVETTLKEKPKGATHWSTRSMAKRVRVSHTTVATVWHRYNLKPHLTQSFKLSKDPRFVEKLVDVVGLYMNPPERAVVFSVDEKPQTQALERTQTILPLAPGFPEGRPYDYRRNGTTDLFAALNTLDGTVITEFHHRHRRQEYFHFLRTIERSVPGDIEIHIIADNLSTHKGPAVEAWNRRHPRFRFHYVPTGSSWLNAVEQWLGQLDQKRLKRGSFRAVRELKEAIREFSKEYAKTARPFVWTKTPDELIRKINKVRSAREMPDLK